MLVGRSATAGRCAEGRRPPPRTPRSSFGNCSSPTIGYDLRRSAVRHQHLDPLHNDIGRLDPCARRSLLRAGGGDELGLPTRSSIYHRAFGVAADDGIISQATGAINHVRHGDHVEPAGVAVSGRPRSRFHVVHVYTQAKSSHAEEFGKLDSNPLNLCPGVKRRRRRHWVDFHIVHYARSPSLGTRWDVRRNAVTSKARDFVRAKLAFQPVFTRMYRLDPDYGDRLLFDLVLGPGKRT